MSVSEDGWERLPDVLGDLGLSLRFPRRGPAGDPVVIDDVRIHIRSLASDTVYFEVSRHRGLNAAQLHAREKRGIEATSERKVSDLSATFGGRPAWVYRISWSQGEREVALVEHHGYIYRILHNPRSELSRDVVATVEFA
jgi:hypothetical protein